MSVLKPLLLFPKLYYGQDLLIDDSLSLIKRFEVGDHLLVNPDHNITWHIIAKAPAQTFKQNILEAFYIRKLKPTPNSQNDIKITHLFRNGIT